METLRTITGQKKTNFFRSAVSGLCNTISVVVFLFLMLYFMIMRSVGLHELFTLRDFNIIFLLGGILLALFSYGKMIKSKIDYITGLKIGMRVTLTAVLPFALFMYFYILTDDSFMSLLKIKLQTNELTSVLGEFITPGIAAGIICVEGLLSGVIITFVAMQYFKK